MESHLVPLDHKDPWEFASKPAFHVLNEIRDLVILDKVFIDSTLLWKCFVIGGYTPHMGSTHATVNQIWTSPDAKVNIKEEEMRS
ncbi:hypothetical protein N665_0133s0007 [Sinapis alba]|nr:hypothetical protein N665_0133s0007 [Sinapis alba]